MIFCGQCGLQLAPGSTRCPRCGAVIEETEIAAEELHTDDPTVASPSLLVRDNQRTPSNPQQPLILRPGIDDGNNYVTGTQEAYDATRVVESQNYNTSLPGNQGSYPGYPAHPSGGQYPTQGSYPDYATHGAYQAGMSYPNMQPQQMGMGYPSAPNMTGQYPYQEQTNRNARGRTAGLVLVLLGLLLILSAVVLFAIQQGFFGNSKAQGPETPTVSIAASADTIHQAQGIIHTYYDSINKQGYQTAYVLWKDQTFKLATV